MTDAQALRLAIAALEAIADERRTSLRWLEVPSSRPLVEVMAERQALDAGSTACPGCLANTTAPSANPTP